MILDDGGFLGKDETVALLNELEPLLVFQNAQCIDLVDELRRIPESDELCGQVEDFDFAGALKILAGMKAALERQ